MAPQEDLTPRHMLHLTISDEGYVEPKLVCPHDPPTRDMPCCARGLNNEPVDAPYCVVGEWVKEIGMEAFKGTVEVPPIPIRWWFDGWGEDAEFWFEVEP